MANCVNCGTTLEASYKFCIVCGTAVPAASVSTTPDDASAASSPLLSDDDSDITAHFDALDDDDLIEPPKKLDGALIFGIAMAVAGAVLIILVAIAVFSPHR